MFLVTSLFSSHVERCGPSVRTLGRKRRRLAAAARCRMQSNTIQERIYPPPGLDPTDFGQRLARIESLLCIDGQMDLEGRKGFLDVESVMKSGPCPLHDTAHKRNSDILFSSAGDASTCDAKPLGAFVDVQDMVANIDRISVDLATTKMEMISSSALEATLVQLKRDLETNIQESNLAVCNSMQSMLDTSVADLSSSLAELQTKVADGTLKEQATINDGSMCTEQHCASMIQHAVIKGIEAFGHAVDRRFQSVEAASSKLSMSVDIRCANLEQMAQETLNNVRGVEIKMPLVDEQLTLLRKLALEKSKT